MCQPIHTGLPALTSFVFYPKRFKDANPKVDKFSLAFFHITDLAIYHRRKCRTCFQALWRRGLGHLRFTHKRHAVLESWLVEWHTQGLVVEDMEVMHSGRQPTCGCVEYSWPRRGTFDIMIVLWSLVQLDLLSGHRSRQETRLWTCNQRLSTACSRMAQTSSQHWNSHRGARTYLPRTSSNSNSFAGGGGASRVGREYLENGKHNGQLPLNYTLH